MARPIRLCVCDCMCGCVLAYLSVCVSSCTGSVCVLSVYVNARMLSLSLCVTLLLSVYVNARMLSLSLSVTLQDMEVDVLHTNTKP